jgi:hypothetical protein
MASAISDRMQPFQVAGGLRGQISDIPIPDILQHLAEARATGILTLTSGGVRKALYFNMGRVVFASSDLPEDRLGDILVREGKITIDDYEASLKAVTKGKRQGRVLVEMAALSPKDLWEGVQFQVREIVLSVFAWNAGQFHFEASGLPERERITVDLAVTSLVLSGLRRVSAQGTIESRYPRGDLILHAATFAPEGLEPYEEHIRKLVDGERSVAEICRDSEIGENETLKVLYGLLCVGALRIKGRKVRAFDQDFVPAETLESVIVSFNQMYGFVFRHMVREVGPIAENVLEKYLGGLREQRKEVLAGLKLQKDGTLDPSVIERNVHKLPEAQRRPALVEALNELLYAELLAVKRTLGAEHEAAVIRALRER